MLQRTLSAGFIAPCLPTKAQHPPSGPLWLHEIKHDGFRVIARKDGSKVRLYSRPGNDLTDAPALPRCRPTDRYAAHTLAPRNWSRIGWESRIRVQSALRACPRQ
jgi:hypothetical protein